MNSERFNVYFWLNKRRVWLYLGQVDAPRSPWNLIAEMTAMAAWPVFRRLARDGVGRWYVRELGRVDGVPPGKVITRQELRESRR